MKAREFAELGVEVRTCQEELIRDSSGWSRHLGPAPPVSEKGTKGRDRSEKAMETRRRGADLPDLRILSRDELLLQEDVDFERASRLIERLSADEVLKNPPIVASLDGGRRYLLLD